MKFLIIAFILFLLIVIVITVIDIPYLKNNPKGHNNADIYKRSFPNIFCLTHLARIDKAKETGLLNCRISPLCIHSDNIITNVVAVVGIIGIDFKDVHIDTDYFINVLDENDEIRFAAYNRIDIYSNHVNDINAIIHQLIDCFYNNLDKGFDYSKIVINIYDKPDLTKSTENLLNNYFKIVNYYDSDFESNYNDLIFKLKDDLV